MTNSTFVVIDNTNCFRYICDYMDNVKNPYNNYGIIATFDDNTFNDISTNVLPFKITKYNLNDDNFKDNKFNEHMKHFIGMGYTCSNDEYLNAKINSSQHNHIIISFDGTIDNYQCIKSQLIMNNYIFKTDLTSELLANFIEYNLNDIINKINKDFYHKSDYCDIIKTTLINVMSQVNGKYHCVVSFSIFPGNIFIMTTDNNLYATYSDTSLTIVNSLPSNDDNVKYINLCKNNIHAFTSFIYTYNNKRDIQIDYNKYKRY